ncbi:MAG: hypothetical protein M3247_06910, partial [Thermoproteota archaeon]|nr:hypothetical protein [Thermoproteota archaeon]
MIRVTANFETLPSYSPLVTKPLSRASHISGSSARCPGTDGLPGYALPTLLYGIRQSFLRNGL